MWGNGIIIAIFSLHVAMIHVPPPTAPVAHTFKLTFEIHDLPLLPKHYMCTPLLLVDF